MRLKSRLTALLMGACLAMALSPSGAAAQESGRFRVTVTGFLVNHETVESAILRDGRGDEVFVLANFAELLAGNRLLGAIQARKSLIFGDTDGRPGPVRAIGVELEHLPPHWMVQAGSMGPHGGLQAGDRFPDPAQPVPPIPSDALPQDRGRFLPMVLWEGELRRGGPTANAIVLLPTIWENDNATEMLDVWMRQAPSFLRTFAASSDGFITGRRPRPLIERVDRVLDTIPKHNDFDRPIGLDGEPYNPLAASPGSATFVPAVMLLTFTSAQEAANSNTTGRGVVEITYRDGARYGPGSYTIFLRVERLP